MITPFWRQPGVDRRPISGSVDGDRNGSAPTASVVYFGFLHFYFQQRLPLQSGSRLRRSACSRSERTAWFQLLPEFANQHIVVIECSQASGRPHHRLWSLYFGDLVDHAHGACCSVRQQIDGSSVLAPRCLLVSDCEYLRPCLISHPSEDGISRYADPAKTVNLSTGR
jgi:hypothetical protein